MTISASTPDEKSKAQLQNIIRDTDIILDYDIYPTFLFDINPGDEIELQLRVIYNGEQEYITLERIESIIPSGFRFICASKGEVKRGNNVLLLDNYPLYKGKTLEISITLKAEKALGSVKYQPILYVTGIKKAFEFPREVIKTGYFEDIPFLKIDYLEQKMQAVENDKRSGLGSIIHTPFMDKVEKLLKFKNVIVYGPPGSGKTYLLLDLAQAHKNSVYINFKEIMGYKQISKIHVALIHIILALEKLNLSSETPLRYFIKELLKIKDKKEITLKLLSRLKVLASQLRTKMYLLFDAMDRLEEDAQQEFVQLIRNHLRFIPNLRLVVTSRSKESVPLEAVECPGFSDEDALRYLSEFKPTKIVLDFLPKPILPIYLRLLKIMLIVEEIPVLTVEIARGLPKGVEEFHEALLNEKLNETEKKIVEILSLFRENILQLSIITARDLVRLKIEALAFVLKVQETDIEKMLTTGYLKYLVIYTKEKLTLFHSHFENYIFESISNKVAAVTSFAKVLAALMYKKQMNAGPDTPVHHEYRKLEAFFLTFCDATDEAIQKRFLQIYYPIFKKEYGYSNFRYCKHILNFSIHIHKLLNDRIGIAKDLGNIGLVLRDLGKLQEALQHHRQAYKIDEELGNKLGMANDLTNIGLVLMDLGKPQEALIHFKQAYKIHKELGNKLGMAADLGNMGLVLMELGKPQEALNHHRQAYKIHKELDNKLDIAADLGNMGLALMDLDKPQEALNHFKQAYEIHKELGNKIGIANDFSHTGLVLMDLGKSQEALSHFKQAYEIHKELGNKLGVANDLNNMGLVLMDLGKLQEALQHHQQAYEIHKELGNKLGVANALNNRGLILMDLGKPQKALQHHQQAYEIDKELGNKLGMARDLGNIGIALMDLGNPQKALKHFKQAYEIHKELGNKIGMVADLGNMGLVLMDLGKPQEALNHFKQAYEIHKELGDKLDMAKQLGEMCICLATMGRIEEMESKAVEAYELTWSAYPKFAYNFLVGMISLLLKEKHIVQSWNLSIILLKHTATKLRELGDGKFSKSFYVNIDLVVTLFREKKFSEITGRIDKLIDFFKKVKEENFVELYSIIKRIAEENGQISNEVEERIKKLKTKSKVGEILERIIESLSNESK